MNTKQRLPQHRLFFLIIILNSFLIISPSHFCGSQSQNLNTDHQLPITSNIKQKHLIFLQTAQYTPIKIHYDYTFFNSQTNMNEEQKHKIKQIGEQSSELFKSILKVKSLNQKLKVTSCNSGNKFTISEEIKSSGVDADIIIFPFIDSTNEKKGVGAYSKPCGLSGYDNRPLAGYIGITPSVPLNQDDWLQYNISIVMHELTHVLVFSNSGFSFYIDDNGKRLSLDKIIKESRVNDVQRQLIITPKVVEAARKHFNCTTLEGVELENQGSSGTLGNHWESRLMLTDYMVGKYYNEITISEISLALFEDSGWYKVNYYTGGGFRFGKNQGCEFTNTPCLNKNTGKTKFENEFCHEDMAPMCTNGRQFKGVCLLSDNIDNGSNEYKYFGKAPKKGGYEYADYCPIARVGKSNVETSGGKGSCMNFTGNTKQNTEMKESYSKNSMCFISNGAKKSYSRINKNYAICYEYRCDYRKLQGLVKIGDEFFNCDGGGKEINVKPYSGKIKCPEFRNVCTSRTQCSDFIDCIKNKALPI